MLIHANLRCRAQFLCKEVSVRIVTAVLFFLAEVPALAQSAPTPEPSTTLLMGIGLLGIGYVAYRKKYHQ